LLCGADGFTFVVAVRWCVYSGCVWVVMSCGVDILWLRRSVFLFGFGMGGGGILSWRVDGGFCLGLFFSGFAFIIQWFD